MTKLVDDVAEALCFDEKQLWLDRKDAARAAIAVFEKWLDEKCPEVAHIVRARLNAQ